jgi:nucleotide-binding universal stress UspA family protein
MYKNILVPTDLADKSENSIRTALELASQKSGHIKLLHVVEKMGGEPDGEIEGFYSRLGEEASQKLTDWQQKFQAEYPQTLVNKTILVGKRAQEILGFCQEKEIDLIVMTSRTFNVNGNNKEISGVGTLSHKIALFSPVSVLVVR